MNSEDCFNQILTSRKLYDNIKSNPNLKQSGVYGIFLIPNELPFSQLEYENFSNNVPLYIGISQNLKKRHLKEHFEGHSSQSTLRRSIGALFQEERDLMPIPRSKLRNNNSFNHYSFKDNHEKCITKWMKKNLVIGYCFRDYETSKDIEKELIQNKCPVLNIKDSKYNPDLVKKIKKLRKLCANLADSNSTQSQLRV
jgi:hypothetical protein